MTKAPTRSALGPYLHHPLAKRLRPLMRRVRNAKRRLSHPLEDRWFLLKERLTGYEHELARVERELGYRPNLENPRSFNEKLLWKKLHERDPLLPIVGDKLRARDFIRHVLGTDRADAHLVPILYVTDEPDSIPFDRLPEEYIVKANHGSGTNVMVQRGEIVDRARIVALCQRWLNTSYGLRKHEWHYQRMKRKILIEPLLRDQHGILVKDYRFNMIHGHCAFVQIYHDQFANKTATIVDSAWQNLDVTWRQPQGPITPKPSTYETMSRLASLLAAPFDYMRVDFYTFGHRIFLGELTAFPMSCAGRFDPPPFDLELGNLWDLKPGYWKEREDPTGKMIS